MATENRIKETLHRMVCEEARLEEGMELPENIRLIENLGFDSVQLITLIAGIEEEFDIEFMGSSMLFERFNRFGDLCDLVREMVIEKDLRQGDNNGKI